MVKPRRLSFDKRILLIFIPAAFVISFVLLRGNHIDRRVPILTSEIAQPACHTGLPSSSLFDTVPFGVIQEGASGIAYFHFEGTFGACAMTFSNGSWRTSLGQLRSSTSAGSGLVLDVAIDASLGPPCTTSSCSGTTRIALTGSVGAPVTTLVASWGSGQSRKIPTSNGTFFAWLSLPTHAGLTIHALNGALVVATWHSSPSKV